MKKRSGGLTGKAYYYAFLAGAKRILENQKELNRINVFPVPDADTGSNLASTVRAIIERVRPHRSYKVTSKAIAAAALEGARGNSGVILAQFLYGMAAETADAPDISLARFGQSVRGAVLPGTAGGGRRVFRGTARLCYNGPLDERTGERRHLMVLKYALLWLVSFIGISAVDAFWHLALWGRTYREGVRRIAALVDGRPVFHNASGALSQVLVVTALVVLASLQFRSGAPVVRAIVACAMGGVLGISVYGLVNHWLVRDWSGAMTVLEAVWGPLLGAFAGWFIATAGRVLKVY